MRVVCTGQSGLRKGQFLKEAAALADPPGSLKIFSVAEFMEKEAGHAQQRPVSMERILQKPLHELNLLRRSALKGILAASKPEHDCILNTHAVFRWSRGVFQAFDLDQLAEFAPEAFVTLIDDFPSIYHCLKTDKSSEPFDLRDVIVWREEEIITSRFIARALNCPFYVFLKQSGPGEFLRLVSKSDQKKAYLSFPITRLKLRQETKLIEAVATFKRKVGEILITFDPYHMSEYNLVTLAETGNKDGKQEVQVTVNGESVSLSVDEILGLKNHLEGQIIARDFALIDQSDMVVAYFVLDEKGVPEISAGSQTELAQAFGLTKETYVICEAPKALSPWVTKHATKVFTRIEDAQKFLAK